MSCGWGQEERDAAKGDLWVGSRSKWWPGLKQCAVKLVCTYIKLNFAGSANMKRAQN